MAWDADSAVPVASEKANVIKIIMIPTAGIVAEPV